MEYSYQFSDELQQEWEWSERYAAQPEILRYADHVADRFDLRRDIQFDTRVSAAAFDEAAGRWAIETRDGARTRARVLHHGDRLPLVAEHAELRGPRHLRRASATTPATGRTSGVDFTGKRVAIIGTGSSAVQSIPIIAEQATHLTVFQRTPNYAVPAHNAPLDPEVQQAVKAD